MLIGDYGTPPNPYANGLLNPWADPRSPGNGFLALAAAINPRNRFVAGMQNYGQQVAAGQDAEMKRRYMGMQMQEAEEKMLAARQKREALQNLPDPGFLLGQSALLGGGGPTNANAANIPAVPPHLQQLHQFAKSGLIEPEHYIKAITPTPEEYSPTPQFMRNAQGQIVPVLIGKSGRTKELPYQPKPDIKLQDTGGGFTAVDTNALTHGQTINKTANPFSDLLVPDAAGRLVPNAPLVGVKGQIAAQGAPRVQLPAINIQDPTAVSREARTIQDQVRKAFEPHNTIADQYRAMQQAAQNPSPQGDTALLYSFFKVLDPASTVREGEIALVQANRSIPDRFKGYAQKLAGGGSLLPHERQDLLEQATRQVQARMPRAQQDLRAYRDNVQRLNLDPNLYAPDPYDGIFSPKVSAPQYDADKEKRYQEWKARQQGGKQ